MSGRFNSLARGSCRNLVLGGSLALSFASAAIACSKDGGKSGADTAPPASAKAPTAAMEGTAAKAVPAAPEGKPRVEGQGFLVEVKSPESSAIGAEGVAQVVLNATGGYHLNKEFPSVLEVTPPAGVELGKTTFKVADASSFGEKQATWDVKFTVKDAGEKKFGASFRFAVCTETTCDPKKEALAWTVPVK